MCRLQLALLMAGLALLAACGAGESVLANKDISDDSGWTDWLGDTSAHADKMSLTDQPGSDVPSSEVADGTDSMDWGTISDLPPADASVVPGEPGWPCDSPEDCLEPFCLDGADGKVCSTVCVEECPFDWLCKEYPPAQPDLLYVCIPPATSVCRPCLVNGDCLVHDLDYGERCVNFGAAGAFCSLTCGGEEGCADGFECKSLATVHGEDIAACVPLNGGECSCRVEYVNAGAWTECYEANSAGICWGQRLCTGAGLSSCDAAIPAPEDCNGEDDNCDGQVDEEILADICLNKNNQGSCFGEKLCVDGNWSCDAKVPEAEICDGKDNDCDGDVDETFADSDGDGLADCLTDDADGDGVKNQVDNCPFVANAEQKDADLDTIGNACDPDDDNDQYADADDCAPFDKAVNPGADEICDGKDNDCSQIADDGFPDTDGDGEADCIDIDDDADGVLDGGDCAPTDPDVAPGKPELCNGADEDCDGEIDEGYPDNDGDGQADCIDTDFDGDGYEDDVDNCPTIANPEQEDLDEDGLGDLCDGDDDGDFIGDAVDNCPELFNPFQENLDGDEEGDLCDADDDGDGIPDVDDNCPLTGNTEQSDFDADGIGDECDGDLDGDGEPNLSDCSPADPANHHGAAEVCDGVDNDCDGQVDEVGAQGCESWFLDGDQDGYGAAKAPICLCGAEFLYTATEPGDCNDANDAIYPGAEEVCNGLDDNCDAVVDPDGAPGCTNYYADADSDGYGAGEGSCLCKASALFPAVDVGDCDDESAAIHPNASEVCNEVDDDCDGITDPPLIPGCVSYFADKDADGWGNSAVKSCICQPLAPYTADKGGDCDDLKAEVHPAAEEVCNELDDNCDGKTDPAGADGCTLFFFDGDEDGVGFTPVSACLCQPTPTYSTEDFGDCDDQDNAVYPGAAELCNNFDDDCDFQVDELYPEKGLLCDGEDIDFCKNGTYTCTVDGGGTECVNETTTKAELCNGVDDDCDGEIDEDFPDGDEDGFADCLDQDDDGDGIYDLLDNCPSAANGDQADQDGDGIGDVCDVDVDGDGADNELDCAPLDPAIHPAAEEVCNGIDDNCQEGTDEPWPELGVACDGVDSDECANGTNTCKADGSGSECVNESLENILEACGDEVDNDCDGDTNEEDAQGCVNYYVDGDSDNYGAGAPACLCAADETHTVTQDGDCNDASDAIKPGVDEVCDNNVDDNCNGSTDEGCITCQYIGQKYGNSSWACPAGMRMPNQNEYALVKPCVEGKEISYYHGTAWKVGGCNCKWNGGWCGQKSIETFEQGRLCGDYWAHHVCVPN